MTLLALVIVAQTCSGPGCSNPSLAPAFIADPAPIVLPAPAPAKAIPAAPTVTLPAKYGWYEVTENGRDRKVWGRVGSDDRVYWTEQDQPKPQAQPRPQPATRRPEPEKPIAPFPAPAGSEPSSTNGVDLSRLNPPPSGGEKFRASGSHAEQFARDVQAVKKGEVEASQTDDSKKPHLTVIGKDEDRAPVLKDMEPGGPLAWVRDKYLVQDYAPDNWAVQEIGLSGHGKPDIIVQQHTAGSGLKGKVILHRRDYAGGAEALADELRKINPDYNPNLDPGGSGPSSSGIKVNQWVPIGIGGALLLLILASGRREATPNG
jgi:hypothetical protein